MGINRWKWVEDFYFFITNILNSRPILGLISLTETIRNTSSSSYIYPIKDDDVFFEFLKPERDPRIDIYVYVLLNTTNKSNSEKIRKTKEKKKKKKKKKKS